MTAKNPNKYFAYVRKSSEGEERQALSIESQKDKVRELFPHLDIVEVLEEKHSAFTPGARPVFKSMIKRIEKGEANGIIAWHPDRLSRNEIDASVITYMVRTGIIADLKFGSYNFDNSPEGIMMLQMALSQSQYFSSKLGKDVRRGLEKKFEMGWQANMCPNGYMNVRQNGYSTIEVDEERFKIMRKIFDLMLSGSYSVPEILDKVNNEWDFKHKTTKRNKSGKLSRSSLYRMFTNLFYAGIIEYNGKQKEGKHKAMITLEEFDRIQFLLGRKGKPRNKKNDFAYTGIIRCAECDCQVSADKKQKTIKTTGKPAEYTYYRCSHRKASYRCLQPAVEVKELEKQIDAELANYELQEDFKKLFFQIAEDDKKNNPDQSKNILTNLEKGIEKLKLEKIQLTKLSCKGLIPDEEFTTQRNDYEKEIMRLSQKIADVKKNGSSFDEAIEKISYATKARINFKKGSNKDRRDVLLQIGSNQQLKDRKLLITPYKWLIPVKEQIKPLEAKYLRFELNKKPLTKQKSEQLNSLCRDLRRGWDSNPRYLAVHSFSKAAQSTTLTPLHFLRIGVHGQALFAAGKSPLQTPKTKNETNFLCI